jgi:hypothetical protein
MTMAEAEDAFGCCDSLGSCQLVAVHHNNEVEVGQSYGASRRCCAEMLAIVITVVWARLKGQAVIVWIGGRFAALPTKWQPQSDGQ